MNVSKPQMMLPLERPFPAESTSDEIYCNEAFVIDSAAIEDWTSRLQALLTFAAIFSAVLVTLVVDSKTLLEEDNTDVMVDALVFLMNNMANGTYKPYTPPPFRPSTTSIAVNCLFFASLCLSIGVALAAVVALQWMMEYRTMTGRSGSSPEERARRRHYRYEGGEGWKMAAIMGLLPVILHISVGLFFVGLIMWIWGIYRFISWVVLGCGVFAATFYLGTTILAVFFPSCPYRTPVADWSYYILHLFSWTIRTVFSLFSKMLPWKCEPGWETPEGSVSDADSGLLITREESTFYSSLTKSWQKMPDLFSQSSLAERDKLFIRHTSWKPKSIIWLLNQISISPDVYQRILTPINELSTIVEDSDSSIHNSIPWTKIFQALADRYISFLWNDDLTETAVIDYALQIQCLNSPSLKAIIDEELGNDTGGSWIRNKDSIQILRYWIMSFPLKASRSTIEQIVSDQLLVRDLVRSISSSRLEFCKTWISLFSPDEKTTCMRLLPKLLDELSSSPHDKLQQRLDAILYIICTGRIPWDRTVDIDRESWGTISLPATPLTRRLQAVNWINKLDEHEHGLKLVRELYHLQEIHLDIWPVLYGLRATDDEIAELVKISPSGTAALIEERKKVGPVLRTALSTFDRMLNGMEDDDKEVEQCGFIVGLFYTTLIKPDITPGITSLDDWTIESLNKLQNPCLQVLASVAVGISWNDDWSSGLGNWSGVETPIMSRYPAWERVSELCLWDPPFLDTGDIWGLRLRLWNHLPPLASREYLSNVIIGLDTLMDFERGLSSSNIGIKEAGDFILAVIHLHLAYGWTSNTLPNAYESLIPDLLVGDTTNLPDDTYISTQCIEHLSSICRDISTNPVRLICILVELVRADINFHPKSRQPGILFKLLKYAKAQLSSKELLLNYAKAHLSPRELPLFVSLWKRLVRYIDESSKQFSEVWENMTDEEMPHQFNRVKNKDLQTICDEVIDILTPAESWVEETEQFSGSWPPWCLRPTGTITNLLDEDLGDDNDIGHVIPTDTIPLLDEQSLAAII